MRLLPSSSQHNSLFSHSKECHERETNCFVAYSHSVVMVESTSDSTMNEKRSKVKWDATEGSNEGAGRLAWCSIGNGEVQ